MRASVSAYQDFVERTHGYDEPGPRVGIPRGGNPWSLADDLSVYEDDRGPYLTRRQAARASQMQRKLQGQRFNPYGWFAVPVGGGEEIRSDGFPHASAIGALDTATARIRDKMDAGDIRGDYDVGAVHGCDKLGAFWIEGRKRRVLFPRSKNPRKRRWISRAVKRPGALRNKFARWYGLKKGQKISPSMYSRGYARAKKRGDTRTMRQINLARSLSRLWRRKKSRRRGRVIRGVSFRPAARRRVANPRRRRSKNGRFVKARKRRRSRRRNCRR